MDVGAWLRKLGLGQYEDAFRDNSVDAELLPRLTQRISRSLASRASAIGECCSTRSQIGEGSSRAFGRSTASSDLTPLSGEASRAADGFGRTPADHGDVLRSCRLNRSGGPARRG